MFSPNPRAQGADAENASPATSPQEFRQRLAELTAKGAEIKKETAALREKLNARFEEIDRNSEIQALRKKADEAKAEADRFLKTDAKLVTLRQASQTSQAAFDLARRKVLDASDEAKRFYKERADLEFKDAMLVSRIRETEFAMERHVIPRIDRGNEDLSAARQKRESLARQMKQARTDAENNSKELKDLRSESDKARTAFEAARPSELDGLYKARAAKEAALRTLVAETLKDEDNALTDARANAAKVRADVTARDKEAASLTQKLAELNTRRAELDKARAETQAALRALAPGTPKHGDKTPADAGNDAARDKEAAALTEKLADLNKQRAELEYPISLAEFQLREVVGRRLGHDPDVRKAEAAAAEADNARRASENASPTLTAARAELDALRRRIGEMEANTNLAPAQAAARAEWMAKDKASKELRTKLQTDAVAGLRPAFEEAGKAESALRASKLAEDEEAKSLNRTKDDLTKERSAGSARRQQIETELRKLYDMTADAESVKAAKDAAAAASKAYDEAYATSDVQKLLEAARNAAQALTDRTAELRKADETCSALNARIAEAGRKAEQIAAQIKALGK